MVVFPLHKSVQASDLSPIPTLLEVRRETDLVLLTKKINQRVLEQAEKRDSKLVFY